MLLFRLLLGPPLRPWLRAFIASDFRPLGSLEPGSDLICLGLQFFSVGEKGLRLGSGGKSVRSKLPKLLTHLFPIHAATGFPLTGPR